MCHSIPFCLFHIRLRVTKQQIMQPIFQDIRARRVALTVLFLLGAAVKLQAIEPGSATALATLKLPAELGHVSQVLPADGASTQTSKIVLIIQDAHGNYTAQKSMAGILDYLAEHYSLKLIFMEGAEGNASLEHLRHTGPLSVRKQTAENYLKAGLISGEEYIDTISDHDWVVWGAEDLKLYEKNYSAMLQAETLKPQLESKLNTIQQAITQIKNKLYSLQLKELESRKQAYSSGEFKLSGYLKYLADQSFQVDLSLETYPNIRRMVGLTSSVREIQALNLLKELKALERALMEKTAQTPEEKSLVALQEGISLYAKAPSREWTSEDYAAYQEHRDTWRFSLWIPQLKELASINGIAFNRQDNPAALDQSLAEIIRFYDATLERDAAILRNVQEKMASEGRTISALVVGGFHSENIAQLLVQNGLNVAILTPVVGQDDPPINYLEIMKYKYRDYQHKHSPRRTDEILEEDLLE